MKIWTVNKAYYGNSNTPTYTVCSYNLFGYLKRCWEWYGIVGLKGVYLSKRQAVKKATELNGGRGK